MAHKFEIFDTGREKRQGIWTLDGEKDRLAREIAVERVVACLEKTT